MTSHAAPAAPASRPVRRAAGPRWPRGDAGAGTAEIAIITPLLMLLILAVLQFAVAEQAQHAAQAAASQALAVTRIQGGTPAAGQAQAAAVLSQLGGSLTSPAVQVTRTATWARVTITGKAESLIPGLNLTVTATVTGPAEEWTR